MILLLTCNNIHKILLIKQISWDCINILQFGMEGYNSMLIWKFALRISLQQLFVLSVTTGFALAALGLPENFEHYLNLVKALEIPAFIIFSGKTALAWPLCYHSFNGIRHLAWDLGFGFDMNILYKTGWFVFIGSMGAAAALAYFLWIYFEFCVLIQ